MHIWMGGHHIDKVVERAKYKKIYESKKENPDKGCSP